MRLRPSPSDERMAKKIIDEDRQSDDARYEPQRQRREGTPDREELAVVDEKSRQHQNVGTAHARHVQPCPRRPPATARGPAEKGESESQAAENEQVIVLGPPDHRQAGGGGKERSQTPEVDRSIPWMAACPLRAEHRHGAGDNAGQSKGDVNPDHRQKDRVGRGDQYSADIRDRFGHPVNLSDLRSGPGSKSRREAACRQVRAPATANPTRKPWIAHLHLLAANRVVSRHETRRTSRHPIVTICRYVRTYGCRWRDRCIDGVGSADTPQPCSGTSSANSLTRLPPASWLVDATFRTTRCPITLRC